MVERFLKQTHFESVEDYNEHLEFIIPEHFNFAYDVMDEWAKEAPEKLALLWTNDEGMEIRATFAQLKEQSDQAASYLQSLGIGKGDPVMLILKRRYEWWIVMLALHKLGAVVIPATHMLTKHDIVYRNTRASVKAIICVNDAYVCEQIGLSVNESPTLKHVIVVGDHQPMAAANSCVPSVASDQRSSASLFTLHSSLIHDYLKEVASAPQFTKPAFVNNNEDTMLMYFTSGTSGEPKMVAHDFLYAMGHLTTGVFWHNLHEGSLHLTVADTGWGKAVWGKFYGQWFAGATVFVFDHEKFNADTLLRQMEKYRVTSFCAPPTIYRFMIREDLSKYDLSALEYCTTAGEALNPAVFDKFYEKTGIRMMEGFGQTETTMTLGTFPWMKPKPGSMGIPNAQYDIDLLRPDGTPCEDGEKGEIVIRTKERVLLTNGRKDEFSTNERRFDEKTNGRKDEFSTNERRFDEKTNGRKDELNLTSERENDDNTSSVRPFVESSSVRPFVENPSVRPFVENSSVRPFVESSSIRQIKPIGLFKGYYRDAEKTREAWHDGIYHTGDMAWRDEDGYYWFEGRIDDVIKSSGYRIGPFEVESALMTHPAVVECAITGVPDDIRGMVVKATVVLGKEWKDKAGDDLVKELQQHVKRETAPYKYPRIVEFVDELPKTISGKIRRVEIRQKDSEKKA